MTAAGFLLKCDCLTYLAEIWCLHYFNWVSKHYTFMRLQQATLFMSFFMFVWKSQCPFALNSASLKSFDNFPNISRLNVLLRSSVFGQLLFIFVLRKKWTLTNVKNWTKDRERRSQTTDPEGAFLRFCRNWSWTKQHLIPHRRESIVLAGCTTGPSFPKCKVVTQ